MLSTEEFNKKVGARIRSIRLEKGISSQELADRMEMEISALSRMEAGGHGFRSYTLYRFADALGITLSELLETV